MSTRILCSSLAWCLVLTLVSATAQAQCTYGVIEGTYEPHAGWGRCVAMSGNGQVTLVGGSGAADNDGIVRTFIWDGSSWVEGAPLEPELLNEYAAEFGWSVALSYDGNTAAVGAPGDMHEMTATHQGAVYVFVFRRDGDAWPIEQILDYPEAPEGWDSFGNAVAIDGNFIMVGDAFDVEPASSTFTITIRFMGMPVEIEFSADGTLIGIVMSDCEGGASSFLLTEMNGTATGEPIAFEIPPQVPEPWGNSAVVVSDLQFTVAEVGGAAALDDDGTGYLAGYRIEVTATYEAATSGLRISAYGAHTAGYRLEVSGTAGLPITVEACSGRESSTATSSRRTFWSLCTMAWRCRKSSTSASPRPRSKN